MIAIFPGDAPYEPIVFRGGYRKQDIIAALDRASGRRAKRPARPPSNPPPPPRNDLPLAWRAAGFIPAGINPAARHMKKSTCSRKLSKTQQPPRIGTISLRRFLRERRLRHTRIIAPLLKATYRRRKHVASTTVAAISEKAPGSGIASVQTIASLRARPSL